MLVHLDIKNLTVVKKVAIAVEQGLTAITGETGAGKSIALDALSLCLGNRADSGIVRNGADKSEVVAHFDISELAHAKHWLDEQELAQADAPDECFIRRIVSKEGRSKAFINGIPVNLQQLKHLGQYLVNIHGQHDHHAILLPQNQLALVDGYANDPKLLQKINESCQAYNKLNRQLAELQSAQQQRLDRTSLLEYQVNELDEFSLMEGEFQELEAEFKKHSSLQGLVESSDKVCYLLKEGEPASAIDLLNHASKEIQQQMEVDDALSESFEMLQNALIQAQEAYSEVDRYRGQLEADPERIKFVEDRFSQFLDFARKHGVEPETLYETHIALAEELASLNSDEASLDALKLDVENALNEYRKLADQLHTVRVNAAKKLSEEVQTRVRELNMPHAIVQIDVNHQTEANPNKLGNDSVMFKVSVNPGQAPDAIDKVVSGGELSRIGLALQVIHSRNHHIPTLVFDEVDTGISGQTASIVGRLLRQLGANSQVICVTHLPQVASQAHNQVFVNKITDGETTETQVLHLSKQERVNEVARLLAGDELSQSAIKNAKELLKQGQN